MQKPTLFYIDEPKLTFGHNQKMADPRDGITLFGPYTRNKMVGQINVGIIGPDEQRGLLRTYLKEIHKPVFSKEREIARPYFPGLEANITLNRFRDTTGNFLTGTRNFHFYFADPPPLP